MNLLRLFDTGKFRVKMLLQQTNKPLTHNTLTHLDQQKHKNHWVVFKQSTCDVIIVNEMFYYI